MALLDEILKANETFEPEGPAPGGYRARRRLCIVTCVDPRLTRFLPQALGIERGDATLVRVPGARVLPGSPLLRSIAAVIYINDCAEVLVLPHTDCGTARVTTAEVLDTMAKHGVKRDAVDGDLREFFGLVGDVRQSAAETVRALREASYLPRGLPIHSAMIDTVTGKISVLERAEAAVPAAGATPPPAPSEEPVLETTAAAAARLPNAPDPQETLPAVEVSLQKGQVWIDGRPETIPGPLARAIGELKLLLGQRVLAHERTALIAHLDDAFQRGESVPQMVAVTVGTLLQSVPSQTRLHSSLLWVKAQIPKISRPAAWALLRALLG